MSLTDMAIRGVCQLIEDGELVPGQRLPVEPVLSTQLGLSRSSLREAVRALVAVGVLDVRRGDGTYVSALTPQRLLRVIAQAVDLMPDGYAVEILECRRIMEPQAAALAALRANDAEVRTMAHHLEGMKTAAQDNVRYYHHEQLHATIAATSGNSALSALMSGLSGTSLRRKLWRAGEKKGARGELVRQQAAIANAIAVGDADLARAASIMYVSGQRDLLTLNRAEEAEIVGVSPVSDGI